MNFIAKTAHAVLVGTAAALLLPATAAAQDANATDNTVYTTTDDRDDEDNDFPWGLLGLAGLAGLLGRKRDTKDEHVDARHDTRK